MTSSSSSSSDSDQETAGAEQPGPSAALPASSVASSTSQVLRVSYIDRKARSCLLCGATSTDVSPLEYTEDFYLEYQGRIPWRSYEKIRTKDGDQVRVPSGRIDMICFNVYRALGAWASRIVVVFFAGPVFLKCVSNFHKFISYK